MFTEQVLRNLIAIVSTHPTPEGVGSQVGQVKVQLISKLSKMVDELKKPVKLEKPVKEK